MLIYLDLDTNRLVIGPGNAGLVGGYATPRGSGPLLRVQPVSGGQLVALPAGFEMTWTVKAEDDWGGDILAYAEDFTQEAGTTVYSCAVNYETTALDALLGIGGTEVESVSLIAQLAWRPSSSDTWRPAQLVDLHLHNSVWRGVPGAPAVTPSSFDWLVASLAASAGVSLTVGVDTITIGLALNAGAGMNVTTDGANKVVAADVQYAVATSEQDFFGGDGVSGSFDDDAVLKFTGVANGVYEVTVCPIITPNHAPASAVNHQARWTTPAGVTVRGFWQAAQLYAGEIPERSMGFQTLMIANIGGSILVTASSVPHPSPNHCIIQFGATAGEVTFDLRCMFTDLTHKITRKIGSYLIARRIS